MKTDQYPNYPDYEFTDEDLGDNPKFPNNSNLRRRQLRIPIILITNSPTRV